jgi:phospholipid/cholesterol/gamma-HCH transport system permease protein
MAQVIGRTLRFVGHLGDMAILTKQTFVSLFRRPMEVDATVYQVESLGIRSFGIVAVTSLFIGMVMCIQFAFGLRRFGGLEYIPRVIVLSFLRELGPTLTAVIVGGRIGSGMAAEVGAMNVTEQVDAIRALGGDPAKKLVLPRVAAAMLVMPLLAMFANAMGTFGAMFVCWLEYDISPQLFMRTSLDFVQLSDLFNGGQDAGVRLHHRAGRLPLRAADARRHRGRGPEHDAHRGGRVDRDPDRRLFPHAPLHRADRRLR